MIWRLVLPGVLAALAFATEQGATSSISSHDDPNNDVPCGLWLAPSTIKGAGLGMFAGVDFAEGQEFIAGGDSVVAIVDFANHNVHKKSAVAFHWFDYTWNGRAQKMDYEGFDAVEVASEGFGASVNCFMDLVNVKEWDPQLVDVGLHRSKDAGAGASTYFHEHRSTAKRHIPAGSELFVNYGENYFKDRTAKIGPVPLTGDLERATRLVQKFSLLQAKLQRAHGDHAEIVWRDVWTMFVQDTTFVTSRVLRGSFHHDNPDDLVRIQTRHDRNVTMARLADSQRAVDWLRHHGTCVDHLTGRPSTLGQAGMGAFATRTLPAGTVVAQLPLIQIPDRGRLEMYPLQQNAEGVWEPIDGPHTGQQLLVNYCLGHKDSTMLLCPYGPMTNYVNHNQTQANVKLHWGRATKGNHMPELLDQDMVTVVQMGLGAKLAMEMIATREIAEGEEIFLDYGDEWEAAWREHVTQWSPVEGATHYTSAAQLNSDTRARLRTVFEEAQQQRYPDNVFLMCDTKCYSESDEVRKHHLAGTLDRYLKLNYVIMWQCSVLSSRLDEETNDYLYTIHLYQNDTGVPTSNARVKDVPRGIFRFVDKPGTSDMNLPNAFRHDVRIPDSLFPVQWRNKQT